MKAVNLTDDDIRDGLRVAGAIDDEVAALIANKITLAGASRLSTPALFVAMAVLHTRLGVRASAGIERVLSQLEPNSRADVEFVLAKQVQRDSAAIAASAP